MAKTKCISICLLGAVLLASCRNSPQAKEAKYLQRGKAQLVKKDYGRAILEFRNAAQVMPRDAEPQYQLGLTYLATGGASTAVAALRKALELNPKHTGAQL